MNIKIHIVSILWLFGLLFIALNIGYWLIGDFIDLISLFQRIDNFDWQTISILWRPVGTIVIFCYALYYLGRLCYILFKLWHSAINYQKRTKALILETERQLKRDLQNTMNK